jgi:DNA-binding transcriptional LysR family regulator
MRLLEEELGVDLFTRNGRGMQLTQAGEMLRKRITGPLRQVGHALNEVRALPSDAEGTVALGMPPSVIEVLGAPLTFRAAAAAPNISLQFVEGASGRLLEWLRAGELDGAVLCSTVTPAGVNATKLLEDDLVLIGGPNEGLRADQAVEFADFAALPLILPSDAHGLRNTLEAAAVRSGLELNLRLQVDSLPLTKQLVAAFGYTALPLSCVINEIAAGRLTYAPLVNPGVTRQLFVAMRSGAHSPGAVLQVEALIRQEVASLAADGRWPVQRLLDVGDM